MSAWGRASQYARMEGRSRRGPLSPRRAPSKVFNSAWNAGEASSSFFFNRVISTSPVLVNTPRRWAVQAPSCNLVENRSLTSSSPLVKNWCGHRSRDLPPCLGGCSGKLSPVRCFAGSRSSRSRCWTIRSTSRKAMYCWISAGSSVKVRTVSQHGLP